MSNDLSQRQRRVGEQVRHALAEVLQRSDLRDPTLDGVVISVSEVRMSPDLRIATAYVSLIGAGDKKATVDALNRSSRYIRGQTTSRLRQFKFMPEFRFRLDTSFENFDKIDRLLRSPEVMRDLGSDDADEE